MNQRNYTGKPHPVILEEIYKKALKFINEGRFYNLIKPLTCEETSHLQVVIDNFEKSKGVLTVLVTSLVHKLHNPEQDIRFHQENMEGGYSGRGIDTKYITPFMKKMGFPAMSESGWLTRSLEQNRPYDFDYPGKITPKELKSSFLSLLDQVQNHNRSSESYLLILLVNLIEHRERQGIELAKPSNLTISTIIDFLKKHFESSYSSRGASRLPTLAIYSVYQCMMKELKRFEDKILIPLEEHTSSDRSSGKVGDVEVRDEKGRVFEVVEIKHGITVNAQLIRDAYKKFKSHPIQRYYLLSTLWDEIDDETTKEITRILNIHGCQVIANGIYPSLKYYLRLLSDPYEFIENYVENLKKDSTIKYEHRLRWNEIVGKGE